MVNDLKGKEALYSPPFNLSSNFFWTDQLIVPRCPHAIPANLASCLDVEAIFKV